MHQNSFPRRLMAALAVVLLVLAIGGIWFYRAQEQQLQQHAEDELRAIAQLKVAEITAWRSERLGDAALLTNDPFFTEGVVRWMVNPQAGQTEQILTRFRVLQNLYHYYDVLLVDGDGQVRLSLSGQLHSLHEEALQALTTALHDRQPVLTDLHFGPRRSSTAY